MKEHINRIGLKRKNAIDRVKWRSCGNELSKQEVNPATCVNVDKTGFKILDLSLSNETDKLIP